MQKTKERYDYLTKTTPSTLVLQLAAPSILSMLVTSLYNMADTFFVGKISTQATAAVGVVFSLMALIQALGFFSGHGSGNYMSRKMGEGDLEEAQIMASTGFMVAFFMGLVLMVIGEILLVPFSKILGALPSTMHDTQNYMRIILVGTPFMMTQLVLNNQLRFQGSAFYAMTALVTGAVINIGLDPLLIFVFKMGVTGAAVATVLSQILSLILLWIGNHSGPNIGVVISKARFTRHYLLEIVNGGAPSLFRQGMACFATIVLNYTAGNIGGDAAIAGMSITTRVMMMLNSALIGFGQGFQPVCSFNYGAKLYKRVKVAFWFCVKYGTLFLLLVSAISIAWTPKIISFFRHDLQVIKVGALSLRLQLCILPLASFVVMSNMMLQSIGRGVKASIMASARTGLFFIPFILILPRFLGLLGVQMAQTCADFCAFLLAIPLTLGELKEWDTLK